MSNHQIKINRANTLAPSLPMASREIMDSISEQLISSLTAAQLAEVKRCLNAHWHKAAAHTEARIIGDGYVWSEQHQALLEVVIPKTTQNAPVTGRWYPR